MWPQSATIPLRVPSQRGSRSLLPGAHAHCRFVLPPLEDQGGDERLVLLAIAYSLSLFGLGVVRQLLDLTLLLSLARDLVHLLESLLVFSLPVLFADLSCSCAFRDSLPLSSSKSHSLMGHKPKIFNDPHVLDLSLRLLAGTDMINVLQPIALFGPVEWQVERPPLGSIDDHAKFLRIPKRHVLSATDDPMLLACRYRRAPEIH